MTLYLLTIEDTFDTMAIEPRVFDTYDEARKAAVADNDARKDEEPVALEFQSVGVGRYRPFKSNEANGFVYHITLIRQGQSVICNGYPGTIMKVCDGQLKGMVEVRLHSGVVCVDITELGVAS